MLLFIKISFLISKTTKNDFAKVKINSACNIRSVELYGTYISK